MDGIAFSYSNLGMSNGHAIMQYRQPMHFPSWYTTGPSGVFSNALTRQAEAHEGSLQCIHCRLRKTQSNPFLVSNSLYATSDQVFGDSRAGFW